ncbi:YcgL domain-containing protein [Solemya elarraichensis gill symbiont]|uniref:YcgL domain-containing protein BOW52_02795 n=1 Tax=Solemya elarraichensis gill symbiont TaxID=1918949 RepID=A0A1T2LC37_9GAMM|nr:YcgL domain-containing protein [Solemya elarraichensis gill symbiont]OOZ42516.1 hypothetical protein BOW52_02795 [Solemya elarraichensis gill symbiont]
MHCWIYKSSRKQEMYLYLADKDGYDELPEPLRKGFGKPSLVMNLELGSDRKLARVDAGQVLEALRTQGYFLQIPPDLEPDMDYGDHP